MHFGSGNLAVPQAVIQRAVDVLTDEVTTCCCFDDTVVGHGIGHLGKQPSFI